MSLVLEDLVLTAFVAVWLVAVVTLFACVIYAIKAVRCARPGVNLWGRDTLWNPANALLSSGMLTDEGLRYRRKSLKSLVIFIACVGGTLLFAAITGQLK
ncbi:hypothetical protein [Dyella sp. A6]|uniref:hypothetical protein n=1 Tax=Dyella aluminiiresistens TaxID=3069105 RepID=UPI002E7940A7|nr:hypothetical protein [Dyella sp. A6]